MLYQVMLFDGSFVDVLEDEADKVAKLVTEGKHIFVQGTMLSPKAVASIKPYIRDFFHGDYVNDAYYTERRLLERRKEKLESGEKPKLLPEYTDA